RNMFTKIGRFGSEVYNNIQRFALNHTHQFTLLMWLCLKMQPAYHIFSRNTLILLDKINRPHFFSKNIIPETFEKASSIIGKNLRSKKPYSFYIQFPCIHTYFFLPKILRIMGTPFRFNESSSV